MQKGGYRHETKSIDMANDCNGNHWNSNKCFTYIYL